MTTNYWITAGSGNWDDPSRWTNGVAPGAADEAVISQPGAFTVTLDSVATVASFVFDAPKATFQETAAGALTTTGTFELDEGTANLSGVNSFGQIFIAGGLLQYASGAALNGGTIAIAGGTLRSTASATVSNFLTISGGVNDAIAIDAKTGTTLNIGNGGYAISANEQTLAFNAPSGGTANTGTIVWHSGNNASLTAGPGDYIDVTLEAGTLQAGDAGFSTLLSSVVEVSSGATIDLHGFSTQAGILKLNAGGEVENTSSTKATLTFGNTLTGGHIVNGVVTGNIAVDVAGAADFFTTEHYTGGTTVEGLLHIMGADHVALSGAIVDNGSFVYGSTWNGSASYGEISGAGQVVVESGMLVYDRLNTFSGGTILTGGMLAVGNPKGLGTINGTGGGGVVLAGQGGAQPILLGTATETIAGPLAFEDKNEIAAATGTKLTLTSADILIGFDLTSIVGIQINDATHAGTVVFEALGGYEVTSGVTAQVTVAAGKLVLGDTTLPQVFQSETSPLTLDAGATLDVNGHDLAINGTIFTPGNSATLVNSSSTAATLSLSNGGTSQPVLITPTGNFNVALTNSELLLSQAAYSGSTTIDAASHLVLAPIGSDPQVDQETWTALGEGLHGATPATLTHANTAGLSGDITDAGQIDALINQRLVLSGNLSGAGTLDIFGAGGSSTAELGGNNAAFNGAVLDENAIVQIDLATGFEAGSFTGFDSGIVFRQTLQTATNLQLDGDSLLAAADGTVATLTGALTLGSAEYDGSSYSRLSLDFGDATRHGMIVAAFSSVTESLSANQPFFLNVDGGTLQAGNATAIPTLLSAATAVSIAKGATLDLDGDSVGLNAFSCAGTITNSSFLMATITMVEPATLTGTINGNVLLDLTAGTLIVTGNLAPAGGTKIESGKTLQIGNGGSTGTLTHAVVDNGALGFDHNVARTFSGTISGTGIVIQESTGQLTISGNNSYSGGTNIDSGAIAVTNAASLGTGNVALIGGSLIGAATTALSALTAAANTTTLNGNVEIAAAHGTTFSVRPSHLTLNGGTVVFGDSTHDGTVNFGATHTTAPGTVSFEIADGQVNAAGSADVFAAGAMKIDGGATLNVNGLAASLTSLTGAGTLTNTQSGTAVVTLGGATNFSGTLAGAIAIAVNGTAVLSGNESFTGTATLDNHATLTIGGMWSEKLIFASGGRVNLTNPNAFTGAIGGFQAGDTVNLDNIAGASATHSWNAATNTLTITGGGHTDTLKFTAGLSAANFKVAGDGAGGTNVIYQAAPQAPVPDALVFSSSNTAAQSSHGDIAIHDAVVVGDIAHPMLGIMDCDVILFQSHHVAVHGDLWG